MGPPAAVAAIRLAVRRALAQHCADGQPVLVACSGGADSVALAAATAFECRETGRRVGLITVDHGLQAGSSAQAAQVAELGYDLGFDPVLSVRVAVGRDGGPEAAARKARYAALEAHRWVWGAEPADQPAVVLLGHTADDQAETMLLGFGRGSGPRSIAGMRPANGGYLRPLLGLRRGETREACAGLGLAVWDDPHNEDPRFRRVRVRTEVLPLLEEVLGGGVVEAFGRTSVQLQADLDALDVLSDVVLRASLSALPGGDQGNGQALDVAIVQAQPEAIRSRVLKKWAESRGAHPLTASHVFELSRLIGGWHGQGPIDLPGGYRARRASGRLELFEQGQPRSR